MIARATRHTTSACRVDTSRASRAATTRASVAQACATTQRTEAPAPAYITRRIPYYDLLDEDALDEIERHADRILGEVGIELRGDEEALGLFKQAGADVTGERVRFEPGQVRALCATAPSQFTQHARDRQTATVLEVLHHQVDRRRVAERRDAALEGRRRALAGLADRARAPRVERQRASLAGGLRQGLQLGLAGRTQVETGGLPRQAAEQAARREQRAAQPVERSVNLHCPPWLTVCGLPEILRPRRSVGDPTSGRSAFLRRKPGNSQDARP